MGRLENYIENNYDSAYNWLEQEVSNEWHVKRVMESLDLTEYLDGKHEILKRPDSIWKGKHLKSRKIVLQYVKPILTFSNSFILKNPITLTSDDEETLTRYKDIYKTGKYNNIDKKILDALQKYGEVYEYLFLDGDKIKSHIIKSVDAYPIIDNQGEYIALIESYTTNGVSYYTLYKEDIVEEYSDMGGDFHFVDDYNNIGGIPIRYLLPSESDEYAPRSDLMDWINIINEMEYLLSKYSDSFYKFLNPMPIMTGTKLSTGKNGEGAIDPNLVGQVIQLEHMSEFRYEVAKMDVDSFKQEYDILLQNLLNISMTPSISMAGLSIANISTDSIRILFYMAIAKANTVSNHLMEGMDERWKKIKGLLKAIDNKDYVGYVNGIFKYDIPSNDGEIIDNLVKMHNVGRVSMETFLSQAPYIYDVSSEMVKLNGVIEQEVVIEE